MYECIFNWEIWSAPAVLLYQKHNVHLKKLLAYVLHFHLGSWRWGHTQTFSSLCLPMISWFQTKTQRSGKGDEVLASLPHCVTTSIPSPFAPPSSSFYCMLLAWHVSTFAFCKAVRSEHLSRGNITRPLLIHTTAAHGSATSQAPSGWAAYAHAHRHRKLKMLRCHHVWSTHIIGYLSCIRWGWERGTWL